MRGALAAMVFGGVAALVLAGCASTGGGSSSGRDVITAAELQASSYQELYGFLRDYPGVRFGPNSQTGEMEVYIRGGGARLEGATGGALLVVDGQEMSNPVSVLQNLRVEIVESVRLINASRAASRYGTRAGQGVIEVTTKS